MLRCAHSSSLITSAHAKSQTEPSPSVPPQPTADSKVTSSEATSIQAAERTTSEPTQAIESSPSALAQADAAVMTKDLIPSEEDVISDVTQPSSFEPPSDRMMLLFSLDNPGETPINTERRATGMLFNAYLLIALQRFQIRFLT